MNGEIMIHIKIDKHKCRTPRECGRCLEVCPESVFIMYPRTSRMPGRKAGNWTTDAVQLAKCNGCGICVKECPHLAITVTIAT